MGRDDSAKRIEDSLHPSQDEDILDSRWLEFLQLMAGSPRPSNGLDTPAPCSLGRDIDLERGQSSRLPSESEALPSLCNFAEPSFLTETPGRPVRQQITPEPGPTLQHADSGCYAQSSATQIPTHTRQLLRQQAGKAWHFPGSQHALGWHSLPTPADFSSSQRGRCTSLSFPQQCQSSESDLIIASHSQSGLHPDEGMRPHLYRANVIQPPIEPAAANYGHLVGECPAYHMPSPAPTALTMPFPSEGEPCGDVFSTKGGMTVAFKY